MKKSTTSAAVVPAAIIEDAWQEVGAEPVNDFETPTVSIY